MPALDVVLVGVDKTFDGDIRAVIDFNAEIEHDVFVAMLGPGGCGKTTALLRQYPVDIIDQERIGPQAAPGIRNRLGPTVEAGETAMCSIAARRPRSQPASADDGDAEEDSNIKLGITFTMITHFEQNTISVVDEDRKLICRRAEMAALPD